MTSTTRPPGFAHRTNTPARRCKRDRAPASRPRPPHPAVRPSGRHAPPPTPPCRPRTPTQSLPRRPAEPNHIAPLRHPRLGHHLRRPRAGSNGTGHPRPTHQGQRRAPGRRLPRHPLLRSRLAIFASDPPRSSEAIHGKPTPRPPWRPRADPARSPAAHAGSAAAAAPAETAPHSNAAA